MEHKRYNVSHIVLDCQYLNNGAGNPWAPQTKAATSVADTTFFKSSTPTSFTFGATPVIGSIKKQMKRKCSSMPMQENKGTFKLFTIFLLINFNLLLYIISSIKFCLKLSIEITAFHNLTTI